ncbi:MAG: hypothetical protein U5R06_15585 [candidate division KSB1 bacterium]|nr:hypothetical protein [candidate division KSB1 bacterium]
MQQLKRKQWTRLLPLLGLAFFVMIGALCPTDTASTLSIVVKHPVEFSVNSSNDSFDQMLGFDLAEALQDIIASNSRLSTANIENVGVSGVTFEVLNDNSAEGTTVSGEMQIGADAASLTTLLSMSNFDLDANEGVEQTPVPAEAGMQVLVNIINSLFDAQGNLKQSNVPVAVSLQGLAQPAPPPDLDFDVKVWLHLSVSAQQ